MTNAYGTKKYQKHREWYSKKEYKLIGQEEYMLEDIGVYALYYEYKKRNQIISKEEFIFKFPNGKKFKIDVLDELTLKPTIVNINGVKHLFFIKNLYGYFFLNLETLEEINYFPSDVLDNDEEAFIIVDAIQFKDLLIMDGCYWGGGCFPVAMDLNSLKLIAVTDIKEVGNYNNDTPFQIVEDKLLIKNDSGIIASFTYKELKDQISKNGKSYI